MTNLSPSFDASPELERTERLYLHLFRPLAPLSCVVAFLVAHAVTGDSSLGWLAVGSAISVLLGVTYLLLSRSGFGRRVLAPSIVIDVFVVAGLVAMTPHPEAVSIAYLWSIALASLFLRAAAGLMVTALTMMLTVLVPILHSGPIDAVLVVTDVIILGVVGAAVTLGRSGEQRARLALMASEARLQEAQRIAQLGSWEWDVDTDKVYWSDEIYRLYGVDPAVEQLNFATILAFVPTEDRAEFEALVDAAINDGEPYDLDARILRRDGTELVVRAKGELHIDRDGARRLAGTVQNVTELRRLETLQDEFVATASHELRTPTTVIVGFAQTLAERWETLDDEQRLQFVQMIDAAGGQLSRLIEDVLQVSRIENGTATVEFGEVDLAAAVADAAAIFNGHPGGVEVQIDPSARTAPAHADEGRVRQVLVNLLSNATRHSPPDRPVQVELTCDDRDFTVAVRDAGSGIAPADQDRIFGRFVRLSGRSEIEGTGLGLYISKRLVELQGGTIWVDSGIGTGTCFAFTVPRVP